MTWASDYTNYALGWRIWHHSRTIVSFRGESFSILCIQYYCIGLLFLFFLLFDFSLYILSLFRVSYFRSHFFCLSDYFCFEYILFFPVICLTNIYSISSCFCCRWVFLFILRYWDVLWTLGWCSCLPNVWSSNGARRPPRSVTRCQLYDRFRAVFLFYISWIIRAWLILSVMTTFCFDANCGL